MFRPLDGADCCTTHIAASENWNLVKVKVSYHVVAGKSHPLFRLSHCRASILNVAKNKTPIFGPLDGADRSLSAEIRKNSKTVSLIAVLSTAQ